MDAFRDECLIVKAKGVEGEMAADETGLTGVRRRNLRRLAENIWKILSKPKRNPSHAPHKLHDPDSREKTDKSPQHELFRITREP